MDAIFTRTSVRKFKPDQVAPDAVEKMLRAAMAAPSACNQQPWEFYVVTNREKLDELAKVTPYSTPVANAPAAFVLCYRKEGLIAPRYPQIDLAIAAENILLEAETLGLGAVMIGIAPHEDTMAKAAKVLDVPDGLEVFMFIAFGVPAEKPAQQDRYDPARVHFVK